MSSTSRQKNKSLGQSETNPVGTGQRVALVLHPEIKRPLNHSSNGRKAKQTRSAEAQLAEAVSLCEAIELELVFAQVFTISNPKPATLIGSGHIEQIASVIELHEVELVVVNHSLTPIQQRNLEKKLHTKVIDRTGLILEIFGARAATKEGTLQVELAALTYQRSRLVRSWTNQDGLHGECPTIARSPDIAHITIVFHARHVLRVREWLLRCHHSLRTIALLLHIGVHSTHIA